jgi:hypothetical protein
MQGMGISSPLSAQDMLDWLERQPRTEHSMSTTISDASSLLLSATSGIF